MGALRFLLVSAAALSSTAYAQKSMIMTWAPTDRTDSYIVRKGDCAGQVVYDGVESKYSETITEDTVYCLYGYNVFGEAQGKVVKAWYEGSSPNGVGNVTIQLTLDISTQ